MLNVHICKTLLFCYNNQMVGTASLYSLQELVFQHIGVTIREGMEESITFVCYSCMPSRIFTAVCCK